MIHLPPAQRSARVWFLVVPAWNQAGPGFWNRAKAGASSSTSLGRQQGFTGRRPVIEHGAPGASALYQAGIEQDLEVAAHRAEPLAGQRHKLRRALRGFQ
jgi:hypothetical protein